MIGVVYTATSMPLELDLLVLAHSNRPQTVQTALELIRPLSMIAMVNSCVDPVIYGLMWSPFRRSLAEVNRSTPHLARNSVCCCKMAVSHCVYNVSSCKASAPKRPLRSHLTNIRRPTTWNVSQTTDTTRTSLFFDSSSGLRTIGLHTFVIRCMICTNITLY